MCVRIARDNELFVAVIQHPQLRLKGALIQQRTEQTEVRDDLAGFGLREVVRQLQRTYLSVVRQHVSTARQNADL